jgi:hypothetical protein
MENVFSIPFSISGDACGARIIPCSSRESSLHHPVVGVTAAPDITAHF